MKAQRSEEQRPEAMEHRPGARGKRREVRFVRTSKPFCFCDAASQLVPAESGSNRLLQIGAAFLVSINAVPSLARRRSLSVIARASRIRASCSRTSARRNMRPTARSNKTTVSSVSRVIVSSTVATRVAQRRNGDTARRCCAVKRAPSRTSLRSCSGWMLSARADQWRSRSVQRVAPPDVQERGDREPQAADAPKPVRASSLLVNEASQRFDLRRGKPRVSRSATWRSASVAAAATRRSMTEVGARSSSVDAAAIVMAFVFPSAIGNRHASDSRLCSGANMRKTNAARSALSCSPGLVASGVIGKCPGAT